MAFERCSGLTSIEIPKSVTIIQERTFGGCDNLKKIVVAGGNPVYDSRKGCNAIIKTKTNELVAGCKNTIIPQGVQRIGECGFRNCVGLTSVKIPEGVSSIGWDAFMNCTGLTSVKIPEGVSSIGEWHFLVAVV